MKHYVFCAGIGKAEVFQKNLRKIEIAKNVVTAMQETWEMDAMVHGHYPDCKITVTEPDLTKVDNGNVEILFESKGEGTTEFINCCMDFARTYGICLAKEGLVS